MLSMNDLHSPLPPMPEGTQAPFTDTEETSPGGGSSAKIDQLIQLLKLMATTDKSLVFSQFTR